MKNREITYIDLFSGIGGFRLALDSIGAKCVFSSEINEHAINLYKENFGDDSRCDITTLNPEFMPDFDILCAGFPCQSFSICGKQKGLYDATRGTLFFDICRILNAKKPKVFILENVQNLEKHDKGNTLFIMLKALNELGYFVSYKILNAKDFGTPQNRERIIIVGNKEGKIFDFDKLQKNKITNMHNFLEQKGEFEFLENTEYTLLSQDKIKIQSKSGLIFVGYRNKKIRNKGVREGTIHLSRVHKQPNRIYSADGIHPTISSQEKSGRYFIYVNGEVRKLTLNECYKFMGFPNSYKKIGEKAKLYERIGNSVCVPMIASVCREIVNQFWNEKRNIKINVNEFLEQKYKESLGNINTLKTEQFHNAKCIVDNEENLKGVYTVLITSLVYKCINSTQDIRLHQANMKNGYSGRSFDTKYITPFLKQKKFLGAMKESGWLTRSLEQNLPYDLNFPGKINNLAVKKAFLEILDDIEKNNNQEEYLKQIFNMSIKKREVLVQIINSTQKEKKLDIDEIINLLKKHFYYKYKSRGASILPVVAIYSIYECIMKEIKRYENKKLKTLSSHYSSDKSSGYMGDIVILNEDNSLYEVVEIKFDILPNYIMLHDIYNKISKTTILRYYILSTKLNECEKNEKINSLNMQIKQEHECQIIVNGIFSTLKYYLRLLENTDKFINCYINNIQHHKEVNIEHKLALRNILENEYK